MRQVGGPTRGCNCQARRAPASAGAVELVVQVNGKTRSTVQVRRDADEETEVAAALRDATVGRFVEGKVVRKRIYVANRLMNLVVG